MRETLLTRCPRSYASWLVVAAMLGTGGRAAAQEAPPAPPAPQAPPAPAAAPQEGDGRARDATGEVVISPEAREKFRNGVQLSQDGRFDEALARFQEAYELSTSFRILFNIGQVTNHLGDYARSLRTFEQYLAEGGRKIDRARRSEVQAQIATLRGQVGTLRIQVEPAGASVSVDGVKIGDAPIPGACYVNPGMRRLRAEAEGRAPTTREIAVSAGQTVDLVLSLGAAGPAKQEGGPQTPPGLSGEARAPAAPSGSGTAGRLPLWIGWAATGALVAGAGITGALALAGSAELADTTYTGSTPPAGSDVARLQGRVDTLAIVTDILGTAAVVGLGVTLYFTFTRPPQAPASGAQRAQNVTVGLGARGISLGGAF